MRSTYSSKYRRLLARLREARIGAGLTQTEVAAAVSRTQSFVSKCESGERRLDVVELSELGRIYGKPLAFFVAEVEDLGPGTASLSAEAPEAYRSRGRRRSGKGKRGTGSGTAR